MRLLPLVLIVAGLATATASAQIGRLFGEGRLRGYQEVLPNPEYDGRFTFVRLRYGPPTSFVGQQIPWSHDYPGGEQHFMQIVNEVSNVAPHIFESSILALDDPELGRYPISYLAEPGYWRLTEAEALAFRKYLQKGGFVIFDDFAENRGGWAWFEYQMAQVMPEGRWVELDGSHPIFHSFFEIPSPHDFLPPYDRGLRPVFYGMFEDNDPEKRLIAIANYNNDISEYWEFSEQGLHPFDETNEAYKFGVNSIIYGMTQ